MTDKAQTLPMIEQVPQWPNNICGGEIRYAPASNYDGFYLADAMHGIPTFGSVSPTDPVTIRDQRVRVFNYPGQTEQIAAELVKRWNEHASLKARIQVLEEAAHQARAYIEHDAETTAPGWRTAQAIVELIDAALQPQDKANG